MKPGRSIRQLSGFGNSESPILKRYTALGSLSAAFPSMKLIFLYGQPATGKLTVAKELAALTGYKLFHNHLAVDLLLSVFDFGSEPFVQLREEIWLSVFASACETGIPGLIFTFAPETTVRSEFIPNALATIQRHHGEIIFVELTCPLDEVKRRIASESRARYQKLTDLTLFEQLHAAGVFSSKHMPAPTLSIDTSLHSPTELAAIVARELKLQGPPVTPADLQS